MDGFNHNTFRPGSDVPTSTVELTVSARCVYIYLVVFVVDSILDYCRTNVLIYDWSLFSEPNFC